MQRVFHAQGMGRARVKTERIRVLPRIVLDDSHEGTNCVKLSVQGEEEGVRRVAGVHCSFMYSHVDFYQ